MDDITRIDTFVKTLQEASATEPPPIYNYSDPTGKLIALTGDVYDLCWEIAATVKHADPSSKIVSADSIKYDATNIINICITELKNLGHTTESAIELIATDGAL